MPKRGVSIARVIPIPRGLYDRLTKIGFTKEAILRWWYTTNIVIEFPEE